MNRRGMFSAFTAIGFVLLTLSLLFLLPLMNQVSEAIITDGAITDPIQQFFMRAFPPLILLVGLFSAITFIGASVQNQQA